MSGEIPVIVATNAFGMGVDKTDVRAVIHFHPPSNLPAYIQEAGRGGRDNKAAYALLLHSSADWGLLKFMADLSLPQLHHAQALLRLLEKGVIREYNDKLVERINEALSEEQDDLEADELTWLLNTMQQSNLLEYDFEVGKARLYLGDWKLLDDIGADNLALLEKLGVTRASGQKTYLHSLDFAQLSTNEAEKLSDKLHEQRRRCETPLLQFASFEPCLELHLKEVGNLPEFNRVLNDRLEKRKNALKQMQSYAQSKVCYRHQLLRAFNEPTKPRDRDTCCGQCNDHKTPWQIIKVVSETDIAEHYRPNRVVLEFLRDHKSDFERYVEFKRKSQPEFQPLYSGLGKLKIGLILQGKLSSPPLQGKSPIRLKSHESNSKHFGNLIGVSESAIEKALTVLWRKNWVSRQEYQGGATYRISEHGLQELEKSAKREKSE
jgi:ATP-dependent DNA helicase RecQ